MTNFWLLAITCLQLLLLLAWQLQSSVLPRPWVWWAGIFGIAACCFLIGLLVFRIYRSLLWRRRKSVRPSREVLLERRRIATALHDGVGSQLVSAMTMAEANNDLLMRATLDQCLLDLRVLVDSMDAGNEDTLITLLGRFRHRIQAVLERRNIVLHWNVGGAEMQGEEAGLPRGPAAREILAILQEAVSNTLQHASASEIWITLSAADISSSGPSFAHARLSVEDNGQGFTRAGQGSEAAVGMGLINMRRRALASGSQLTIEARDGGGTVVRLSW